MSAATVRARGSYKWTVPGPDGLAAGVAEMDFGAAPPIVAALERLTANANFGYLSYELAGELAEACAQFQQRRYGWTVDPSWIHDVPDVLKALEIAITHFSRPGSPVILPTPSYMPFLVVPGLLGRKVIQVQMVREDGGYRLDLEGVDAAFRAGGQLLIYCNPHNPLGRVFTASEMAALTEVVDRHGGRVFSDEIHAPLVYPGAAHLPYASTSQTAAHHTLTATSASKAWNLAGLKCAEVILTSDADEQRWQSMGGFASQGASTAGVVASIAAFREGEPWLADALDYLDGNRRVLADLLARDLPGVRYQPPEATYLAWLDCTGLPLSGPPGALVTERAHVSVIDGPLCGAGGAGSFRVNFATPQPILVDIVARVADALNGDLAGPDGRTR